MAHIIFHLIVSYLKKRFVNFFFIDYFTYFPKHINESIICKEGNHYSSIYLKCVILLWRQIYTISRLYDSLYTFRGFSLINCYTILYSSVLLLTLISLESPNFFEF